MSNSMKLKMYDNEECYLAFEICGKKYKLSEYDHALTINRENILDYYNVLEEFPYSVRKLTNSKVKLIKDAPMFILYRDKRISLYDFLTDIWNFEKQLPLSEETNGLEVIHDLEISMTHFKNKDNYHTVIYETFRILQDFHFLITTARWALIQAHRILHFRSGLIWKDGWEQLWTRATWLNNAIVLYDSCFDKIIQAIWIGTEGYKCKQGLNRTSLWNIEDLEKVYNKCWRRDSIKKISEPFMTIISDFHKLQCAKQIAGFAQKIKHRGGMRYEGLFPFGQIAMCGDGYDPFATRNTNDLDDVVIVAKDYHIEVVKLADSITSLLLDLFKVKGYLTGEDIVL